MLSLMLPTIVITLAAVAAVRFARQARTAADRAFVPVRLTRTPSRPR